MLRLLALCSAISPGSAGALVRCWGLSVMLATRPALCPLHDFFLYFPFPAVFFLLLRVLKILKHPQMQSGYRLLGTYDQQILKGIYCKPCEHAKIWQFQIHFFSKSTFFHKLTSLDTNLIYGAKLHNHIKKGGGGRLLAHAPNIPALWGEINLHQYRPLFFHY